MSLDLAVAGVMFAGVLAYAVLGGADFGSGFFDLTAGGDRAGAAVRTRIDQSIGPVWEANHVWLIFVLVTWWSAFPTAFAATMDTLILPLLLALLGIVLRGSSFAFRKYAATIGQARLFGAVFALSSVVTPFFLGAAVGAIASGRVGLDGRADVWSAWLTPTSFIGGALAVGTCVFLAGCFLVADARRGDDEALVETLRRRTLAVGAVTGLVVAAGLLPLRADSPTLWAGLTGRALPLVVLAFLAGTTTMVLLHRRRYAVARVTAVLAVAAVVSGWGVGQLPWLLVDEITVADAAGATATLQGLLVAFALAAVLVLPPLVYLLRLTQSEQWSRPLH